MVDQVINGMIAGIVGAVAFVAVQALVGGAFYGPSGHDNYSDNATYITAVELIIHDFLHLVIAIMVIAGLFMGLTRVKGV